jgi:Uma2 family endonuclease
MSTVSKRDYFEPRHPVRRGEPAWDIALLYPPQGIWTEREYLDLDTNQLIEFVDGCLEFLPVPTLFHQRIAEWLYEVLKAWIVAKALGGEVHLAPLRVRTLKGKIRQPDIVYLLSEHLRGLHRPPQGAKLVMEVVSGGKKNRGRDLIEKRREYARAKIAEYWIIDPKMRRVTVLVLDGKEYRVHGRFAPAEQATSVVLAGFAVSVSDLFAAGKRAGR